MADELHDAGAVERLAKYAEMPDSGSTYEMLTITNARLFCADVRVVLAYLSRLQAAQDAAHLDGWRSAVGAVGRLEDELDAALARLDAVRRLCDEADRLEKLRMSGMVGLLSSSDVRAVLDSPPSGPAEHGEVPVDRWAEAINEYVGHCGNLDCNCDLDDNHIADRIIECFRDAGWQVVERPSPPPGPEVSR